MTDHNCSPDSVRSALESCHEYFERQSPIRWGDPLRVQIRAALAIPTGGDAAAAGALISEDDISTLEALALVEEFGLFHAALIRALDVLKRGGGVAQTECTPQQEEISKCWETLEGHGFPPEACGWPFKSIVGELPNAIDCAIDCLVRQREALQTEVDQLRASSVPSTERPFDPTEWEKIVEDRQESVAVSSPERNT